MGVRGVGGGLEEEEERRQKRGVGLVWVEQLVLPQGGHGWGGIV